jgi:non-ribosomal peptide synthetase component F
MLNRAAAVRYARALFDATTIERHRGYLVAVLRALVADADRSIARIDLLGAAERALVLDPNSADAKRMLGEMK